MVKLLVGPVQFTPPLLNVGMTTMVATTGAAEVLIAVNEAMLPFPEASRPMLGALLVHA